MKIAHKISFIGTLWKYNGASAWYFITIPKETATDIKHHSVQTKIAWGMLPVSVSIGKSSWNTSLFPDKRTQSYLLPIKSIIRKHEQLEEHDEISVVITLR